MKPYIFAERNGIHIIDLAQTVKGLDIALAAVSESVARGEQVLFVGTKKQAQEPVAQEAARSTSHGSTSAGSAACSRTSSRSRSGSP